MAILKPLSKWPFPAAKPGDMMTINMDGNSGSFRVTDNSIEYASLDDKVTHISVVEASNGFIVNIYGEQYVVTSEADVGTAINAAMAKRKLTE